MTKSELGRAVRKPLTKGGVTGAKSPGFRAPEKRRQARPKQVHKAKRPNGRKIWP